MIALLKLAERQMVKDTIGQYTKHVLTISRKETFEDEKLNGKFEGNKTFFVRQVMPIH